MEGMNLLPFSMQGFVCEQIQARFDLMDCYSEKDLEWCRSRLWYVYGNSAQFVEEERLSATTTKCGGGKSGSASSSPSSRSNMNGVSAMKQPRSPVSVAGVAAD